MNAVPQETAKQAASRLSSSILSKGYRPTALHEYQGADGQPAYWRIRCDHPQTGEKWLRPMMFRAGAFTLGEPEAPPAGRPLYRLPAILANPDALVWIVEGEKCADALARLGLIATTSGGSSSAEGADWTPLRGRRAALWRDNDSAGAKYAEAVASRLAAIGCAVEAIDPDSLGLPEKGDAADWLADRPTATAADVEALPRQPVGARRAGPEPLRRVAEPAAPYPIDALGPVLAPAAAAIQAATQAPAGICGPSILAAASLAAQAHADVFNDGRIDPLSLWCVTVALSGERKSAVDDLALREHELLAREGAVAFKREAEEYERELAAHKAAQRKAESGKPETIKQAMAAIGAPPEPPLSRMVIAPEATLEGLQKLLMGGRPSMGIFSSDAGEFLGGHAMNKDNRTKTAAGLSKLWDNGQFSRVRAMDGASTVYGKRVALHLMIQPVIAEDVLSDPVLVGQGFLPRCLMAWPASHIGTRMYQAIDVSEEPGLQRYWAVMAQLLRRDPPLAPSSRNELAPRRLSLSPEAKALWIDAHDWIERALANDYAEVTAWGSKAAANISRVAGVLALVEDPAANVISKDQVHRAAIIVGWHLSEARRIVGHSTVRAEIRHAEALLNWCHERGRTELCSEVLRDGPNCIRDAETLAEAIAVLKRAGWAADLPADTVVEGKPRKKAWAIHPKGA